MIIGMAAHPFQLTDVGSNVLSSLGRMASITLSGLH